MEVRDQSFESGALVVHDEFSDRDFDRERIRHGEVVQRRILFPRELPPPGNLGERQTVHRIDGVQPLCERQNLARITDEV